MVQLSFGVFGCHPKPMAVVKLSPKMKPKNLKNVRFLSIVRNFLEMSQRNQHSCLEWNTPFELLNCVHASLLINLNIFYFQSHQINYSHIKSRTKPLRMVQSHLT